MRAHLAAGFLAIALVPSLTPVAHAGEAACSIRVLDAPSEIRDALVGWATSEKICHALDVRITPTGEGYSLWARADDGRTFTRWVADAKAAALLVVSWAGDDTLPTADPPPRSRSLSNYASRPAVDATHSSRPAVDATHSSRPAVDATHSSRPAIDAHVPRASHDTAPFAPHASAIDARYASLPAAAPSAIDPVRDRPRDLASVTTTARMRGTRQLVVAAIANPGSGEDVYARTGLRASLDLTTHGAWRVGIAGMLSDERVHIYDVWTGARLARAQEPRASAIGFLARALGNDRVRLGAGAGFAYMQLSDVAVEPLAGTVMLERVGIFAPAIELSAFASIPIARRWAITGGIVLTATGPSASNSLLKNDDHAFAPDHDGGAQLVGALGVARSM
jgi:hypothetical protein